MNKGDYNLDRLEAYIRNELSVSEREEFEESLRQDPLLQNELILQQDIIASIRDYRKNELKQRLNRIDVNGTNSGLGGFQIGGALLTGLTVLGVTGILIFNNFQKENKDLQISAAVIRQPMLSDTNDEDTNALANHTAPGSGETYTNPSGINSSVKERPVPEKQKRTSEVARKNPEVEIVPLLPSDNFEQETFKEETIKKEDVSVAQNRVAPSIESIDNQLVIVDNTNANYYQHYKYTAGQLFLYGFTKPYKILDVKSSKQRYLYYEGSFYRLDSNQHQVSPVQKVVNTELIKELDKLKEEMQ